MRNLDKTASFGQLDRAVTFCFNRFDLHVNLCGMAELSVQEQQIERIRADRWWKRAHHYALVRDTLNASGRLVP